MGRILKRMRRNKKRHVPLQGQGQGRGQRQRQPVIKCGTSSASQEQDNQPRDDHHYRPPTSPPNNHTNKPCLAQHELARPVRSAERPRGATSDGGATTAMCEAAAKTGVRTPKAKRAGEGLNRCRSLKAKIFMTSRLRYHTQRWIVAERGAGSATAAATEVRRPKRAGAKRQSKGGGTRSTAKAGREWMHSRKHLLSCCRGSDAVFTSSDAGNAGAARCHRRKPYMSRVHRCGFPPGLWSCLTCLSKKQTYSDTGSAALFFWGF